MIKQLSTIILQQNNFKQIPTCLKIGGVRATTRKTKKPLTIDNQLLKA